jgi:hypothetical protein
MAENENSTQKESQKKKKWGGHGASNAVYGLGLIGALTYFIQHATTFWEGLLGFFKALVWPAILIYKLLEFLKM